MQSASSSQIPAPPPAPTPVVAGGGQGTTRTTTTTNVIVTSSGELAIPRDPEALAALRNRQRKISDQLISASNRRKDVAQQLEKATDPANKKGLEQRLQVLDDRVARLEGELDQVGRAIAGAPAEALVGGTELSPRGASEAAQIVSVVVPSSLLFVLAMFAIGTWAKRNKRMTPPARSKEELDRLDRLEQAVETIAVEMERVSEGQRFVTRLLTEGRGGQAPAFGNGRDAEPLAIPRGTPRAGEQPGR